jgi:CBS domain-containing protein
MLCPSCGHDNLQGADRCDGCMAPLMKLDVPQAKSGLQERLMEDSIAALNPSNAIAVSLDSPVSQAIELMRQHQVGCVLVMEADRLAGIFTERDFLLKLAGSDKLPDRVPLKDVMTTKPVTLGPEDSLRFALHEMSVGGFRHIPLVRNDKPVGVISIRDVLAYVCREIQQGESEGERVATVAGNSAARPR